MPQVIMGVTPASALREELFIGASWQCGDLKVFPLDQCFSKVPMLPDVSQQKKPKSQSGGPCRQLPESE